MWEAWGEMVALPPMRKLTRMGVVMISTVIKPSPRPPVLLHPEHLFQRTRRKQCVRPVVQIIPGGIVQTRLDFGSQRAKAAGEQPCHGLAQAALLTDLDALFASFLPARPAVVSWPAGRWNICRRPMQAMGPAWFTCGAASFRTLSPIYRNISEYMQV